MVAKRNQFHLKQLLGEEQGQSTIEFAIVFSAVLIVCLTLFALGRAAQDGYFAQGHVEWATHTTQSSTVAGIQDVLLY